MPRNGQTNTGPPAEAGGVPLVRIEFVLECSRCSGRIADPVRNSSSWSDSQNIGLRRPGVEAVAIRDELSSLLERAIEQFNAGAS